MVYEILKDFINKNDLKTSETLIKDIITFFIDSYTLKFNIVDLFNDKQIIKENINILNNIELIELINKLELFNYIIITYENKQIIGYDNLKQVLDFLNDIEFFNNLDKEDKDLIKKTIKNGYY